MFDNYNENQKPTEVSYYPVDDELNRKPTKKRKGVKIFVGVLCALIISAGSIGIYAGATNDWDYNKVINSQPSQQQDTVKDNSSLGAYKSLIELSSKKDAMSVPDIVKKVTPSVVGISAEVAEGTQTGTGIIMTSDGYIITNSHVVYGSNKVTVVLEDKTEYGGMLIGADPKTDLAVIKISPKEEITPAEFGSSDDLVVGELAIAIGNPLGFDFASSVTSGIISGLNRKITIEDTELTLIQTDAAINHGNSGGPLVNSYGQVIGITSAKISGEDTEGMGFAIPINNTVSIVDDLIKNGYVTGRPLIGLTGQDIDEMTSKFYDIPVGIYVRYVTASSPAEKAGIQAGDVIVGINGKDITTMGGLNQEKDQYKPGDTIKLKINRNGKLGEVSLTLAEATN